MIKKTLLLVILGGVIIIIAAVLIIWSPFSPNASLIIEKAITKLVDSKDFKIEGKISAEVWAKTGDENKEPQKVEVSLLISETFSDSGTEDAKTSSDFNLTFGVEGINVNVGGEIVGVKDEIYFKVTTLPTIPFLEGSFDSIKDQWIKIDINNIREQLGQLPKEEAVSQEEFINDIKKIAEGKNYFKIKKNLGKENLDELKVIHYLTRVDKETIKDSIIGLMDANKEYLSEEEKGIYENELDNFLKGFEENFDTAWEKIDPLEIDFWLHEKDSSLYQVAMEKEMSAKDFEMEEIEKIKLNLVFNFLDVDKKMEIIIPKEFKPIEEIIPLFLPESLPVE